MKGEDDSVAFLFSFYLRGNVRGSGLIFFLRVGEGEEGKGSFPDFYLLFF